MQEEISKIGARFARPLHQLRWFPSPFRGGINPTALRPPLRLAASPARGAGYVYTA
jgi:hypothetical protein